jgi:hypothetical protein
MESLRLRRKLVFEELTRLGFFRDTPAEQLPDLEAQAVALGLIFLGVPGRVHRIPEEVGGWSPTGPDTDLPGVAYQDRLNEELVGAGSEERYFWGGLLTGEPFLVLLIPAMADALDRGDCFLDWVVPS